jgi:hypothetical protein
VPPKPPPSFEPLLEVWPAGQPLYRVHPILHPANELFATDRPARFRPLRTAAGELVPMLYGAASEEAALAESVLHDIAPRGPRAIAFESLVPIGLTCLIPQRDLRLAMLHSTGLDGLYDHPLHLDGIVWMSRRYNSVRACVLFGSTTSYHRVENSDLVLDTAHSLPTLAFGDGYELVVAACSAADVLITRP